MSNPDILARIISLFSTMTECDTITEDSEIIDDLEISSMDVLYLITSLEAEFKISVPEDDIRKMVTVGDVAEIIASLQK